MATSRDRGAEADTRPPLPPTGAVARSRLRAFLDAAPVAGFSLVLGPAGSGKTTAVAEWASGRERPGGPLTWVPGDRPTTADLIAAAIHAPGTVVVDAVDRLDERATGTLLSAPQVGAHVVLVGRRRPPGIPISMELTGGLRTARADDLRFDDDEARALVRTLAPDAPAAAVETVLEQADGWAAALVLGARALTGVEDAVTARAALVAARRPSLAYLRDEVVAGLPADLVRVLLSTCQEDTVDPESAVLLSGLPQAAGLLDEATVAGVLVSHHRCRAAGEPHRWRYHPLLLDLLRQRTAPDGPDWQVVVDAHRRAMQTYADRGDPERALQHARLTGDLGLQVDALHTFGVPLIGGRRTAAVAACLAALPEDLRREHPELLAVQATVLRAEGRIDDAKVVADRALAADALHRGAELPRDVQAQLAALEVWQARYGWRESAPALDRAARVLGCRHDDQVSAHDLAGMSALAAAWLSLEVAAFQAWLGDLDVATIHVQDVVMYAEQVDQPVLTRTALGERAVLELLAGAYQTARQTAERAATIPVPAERGPGQTGARIQIALGWSHLQALRTAEARAALAALDETATGQLDPLLLTLGRLLRVCVLTADGEAERALQVLDELGEVPTLLPPTLARLDRLVRMLVAVAMADLDAVQRVAVSMSQHGAPTDALLAEALHAGLAGEAQAGVRMLTELLPATIAEPPAIGLVAAVAQVALLQRAGTPATLSAARGLVPDLLSRSAPQETWWLLAIGCLLSPDFADLLRDHAAEPGAHRAAAVAAEAVSRVRPSLPAVPRPRAGDLGLGEARALLTARELEVIGQLALGGGNADLARALFVSENTVKTHLASIYRKLEVDRRVDALRVARTLGLV